MTDEARQIGWYEFGEPHAAFTPQAAPAATTSPQKRTVAIVGGTRGIGAQLVELLADDFNVTPIGSKDYDVRDPSIYNVPVHRSDICIFSAVRNRNDMVHKIEVKNHADQVNTTIGGLLNVLPIWLKDARRRGYGRFIFLSSVLARRVVEGTGVYAACKVFGERLVSQAARECGGLDVTCNSLRLGYIDAGLTHDIRHDVREMLRVTIPAARWGTCEEVATEIRALIANRYVNGAVREMTGGL